MRFGFLLVLLFQIGCAAGGSGRMSEPPVEATLSGTVVDASSQAPVSAARVAIGTRSTTTGADGRFVLANVPVGTVMLEVDAAGFDSYTGTITVPASGATRTISLARRTIYVVGNFLLLLPVDLTEIRGVLMLLPGSLGDARNFIRGEPVCWNFLPGPCPTDAEFRDRLLELARKHQLALIGTNAMPNTAATFQSIVDFLNSMATVTGHAQLANAPLLLIGGSLGGCVAHGFARAFPARVIGFMSAKGDCHTGGPSPAAEVPGYLFIGEDDPVSPTALAAIKALFAENRAAGAPWAVAVELGSGHEFPRNNDITVGWLDAILSLRLPANGPSLPLRDIDPAGGWLGDNTTLTVTRYECYTGDVFGASWLPNQATAQGWLQLVGGSNEQSCP